MINYVVGNNEDHTNQEFTNSFCKFISAFFLTTAVYIVFQDTVYFCVSIFVNIYIYILHLRCLLLQHIFLCILAE